jgi:hypothetical protein
LPRRTKGSAAKRRNHRRAQGQNSIPAKAGTRTQRPRMKTLLRIGPAQALLAPPSGTSDAGAMPTGGAWLRR